MIIKEFGVGHDHVIHAEIKFVKIVEIVEIKFVKAR